MKAWEGVFLGSEKRFLGTMKKTKTYLNSVHIRKSVPRIIFDEVGIVIKIITRKNQRSIISFRNMYFLCSAMIWLKWAFYFCLDKKRNKRSSSVFKVNHYVTGGFYNEICWRFFSNWIFSTIHKIQQLLELLEYI